MPMLHFATVVFRHYGWIGFAFLLGLLGWSLYQVVPPKPRWTCEGPAFGHGFLPNGSGVVLLDRRESPYKVTVHDTASGRVVRQYEHGDSHIKPRFSVDSRFVRLGSVFGIGTKLTCVDLVSGKVWSRDFAESFDSTGGELTVAPEKDVNVVECDYEIYILDTATGAILSRQKCNPYGSIAMSPEAVIVNLKENALSYWDRKKRCLSAVYPIIGELYDASPSGRFVILNEKRPPSDHSSAHLFLWDRFDPTTRLHLGVDRWAEFLWSPDDSYMGVSWCEKKGDTENWKLAFWDLRTLRLIASFDSHSRRAFDYTSEFPLRTVPQYWFSSDSSLCVANGSEGLEAFELSTGKRRWVCEGKGGPVIVGPSNRFLVSSEPTRLRIVDPNTGQSRLSLEFPDLRSLLVDPELALSKDRRYLVRSSPLPAEEGWLESHIRHVFRVRSFSNQVRRRITVVDLETCTVLENRDMRCSLIAISNDGKSLITSSTTSDGVPIIECWEIPFARHWTWIIGLPATLAALAIGWRLWRGRKRRAKPVAATAPTA